VTKVRHFEFFKISKTVKNSIFHKTSTFICGENVKFAFNYCQLMFSIRLILKCMHEIISGDAGMKKTLFCAN
jgi:hypothetical protein